MTFSCWRLCALLFAGCMSHATTGATPAEKATGLVSHHCFDKGPDLAQDCKGLEHGQVSGGWLQPTAGWRGQGIRLESLPGQTARLVVPNSRRLQFKDGLTFMLAVRPDAVSSNHLMSKGGPQNGRDCAGGGIGDWGSPRTTFGIQLRPTWTYGGGSDFHLGLVNVGPECHLPAPLRAWPHFVDGHWTHVAVTASVSTGHVKTYLNGVLRSEATSSGFTSEILASMNAVDLTLAESLHGVIDEAKVFNRALSAEEVKAQFHSAGLAQPIDAMWDGRHMAAVSDLCFFAGSCGRVDERSGLAGVDFLAAPGTPVSALCTGKVDRVEQSTDVARRLVRVRQTGVDCGPLRGAWTYYGHVDAAPGVFPGATVRKGQVLGAVAAWQDADGKDRSRFHLAVNRSDRPSRWGLVDTGVAAPGTCGRDSVVPRRTALIDRGWVDVLDLGAENGWLPAQRLPDCYQDDFPRAYVPNPYGKGLPYHPFEEYP
jgi:hypothetical protein